MKVKRRDKIKRGLLTSLRAKLARGESDLEIQQDLEITESRYLELLEELYREDANKRFNKPPEQSYIDFCLRQEGCIKDLNALIRKCKRSAQPQAMVSAIRAKSDIIDKMVQRGQDFGLLHKVPEQHQVVGGVVVANMSDAELRAQVVEQLETMRTMMKRYGELPMLEAAPKPLPAAPVKRASKASAEPKVKVKPATETKRGKRGKAKGGPGKRKGALSRVKIRRVKAKSSPPKMP